MDDGFGTVSIELRMPASGDCKVEIKSEAGVSVTAEESENGTLKLYRDCFRKGEKVNFEYPQCTEEIIYTYSRETDIASSVEVNDSCDELKTSDLVSGYKDTLSGLLSLIGSNLDLIPILGGKESVYGLYIPMASIVKEKSRRNAITGYSIGLPRERSYRGLPSLNPSWKPPASRKELNPEPSSEGTPIRKSSLSKEKRKQGDLKSVTLRLTLLLLLLSVLNETDGLGKFP